MPVEKFYDPALIEGSEAETPQLAFTVRWGNEQPWDRPVEVANVVVDRSAINRLIRVLRTARDKTYGRDE